MWLGRGQKVRLGGPHTTISALEEPSKMLKCQIANLKILYVVVNCINRVLPTLVCATCSLIQWFSKSVACHTDVVGEDSKWGGKI